MNPAGDYSAAQIQLKTNTDLIGHGISFTIGQGNSLAVKAARLGEDRIVGKSLGDLVSNFGATWRNLVTSQSRWIGPIHLGLGSCINAIWDLWGRYLDKPVWKIVCDFIPEELVKTIDFSSIDDAFSPQEAIEILKDLAITKEQSFEEAKANTAVPAYTTQAG